MFELALIVVIWLVAMSVKRLAIRLICALLGWMILALRGLVWASQMLGLMLKRAS